MNVLPTFLGKESLNSLLTAVVCHSDVAALNEFHESRKCFCFGGNSNLRLGEFLCLLQKNTPNQDQQLAERAYDLTLSKFLNFPSEENKTDCRLYYKAALETLHKRSWSNELETEKRLGQILQFLVSKHFDYSLQEARRSLGNFSRYNWNHPKGSITVMMPKTLVGAMRRDWLEAHFPKPDLSNPHFKQRVQSLIDAEFENIATHMDSLVGERISDVQVKMPWDYMDGFKVDKLAIAVSEEKADTITQQRQAVQELGKAKLKKLILKIFDAVAHDEAKDIEIANEFGLSKATFSRFAGRKWTNIPDLWRNTASILAHHPTLKELIFP